MKNKVGLIKKLSIFFAPVFTFFILSGTTFAANFISTTGCNMTGKSTFNDIVMTFIVGCVLSNIIFILIGFSVILFLWGVLKYVAAEGDERQAGKDFMIWGIVGLFVILSIWGLVAILQNTFHLGGNFDITPRTVDINL